MSSEGAGDAVVGGDSLRYYVIANDREKGPYTLAQLRSSQRDGALTQATRVRAENEEQSRPLSEVLGLGMLAQPREPSRSRGRGGRPAGRLDLEDVYAPPAEAPVRDDRDSFVPADQGSYWNGFALGFFGGCIALVFTRKAKPETRRGVVHGFGVGLAVGFLVRMIEAMSQGGR